MNKIVLWLKKEQGKLQKKYKKLISKEKGYDFRAVHIHITCGCGHRVNTPYWLKENARCTKCGKWVTTFQKVKEDLP